MIRFPRAIPTLRPPLPSRRSFPGRRLLTSAVTGTAGAVMLVAAVASTGPICRAVQPDPVTHSAPEAASPTPVTPPQASDRAGAPAPAASPPADRGPAGVFADACRLFDEATSLLENSPDLAKAKYAQSAALFRSLVRPDPTGDLVWDHGLLTNAASASFLAQDYPHAVLLFRRAALAGDLDASTARSLEKARAGVRGDASKPAVVEGALSTGEPWPVVAARFTGVVPPRVAEGAFAVCWSLAWIVAGVRSVTGRPGVPRWPIVVLGVGALLSAALLAPAELLRAGVVPGGESAVVLEDVVPRLGPDAVTHDAAPQPLKAGAEVDLVGGSDGWSCVRSASGGRVWIPSRSVETVYR